MGQALVQRMNNNSKLKESGKQNPNQNQNIIIRTNTKGRSISPFRSQEKQPGLLKLLITKVRMFKKELKNNNKVKKWAKNSNGKNGIDFTCKFQLINTKFYYISDHFNHFHRKIICTSSCLLSSRRFTGTYWTILNSIFIMWTR